MTQGDVPKINAGTGRTLGRAALERLLVESVPGPGESASTLYLRPGEGQEFVESLGATGQDWRECLAKLNDSILDSGTGLAALRSGDQCLVVIPPFPLPENRLFSVWDPSP